LQIELLPVTKDDAEELVILRIAAMRSSLERLGRFDAGRARERFLSSFSSEHTRHIAQDGMRVGFVTIRPIGEGFLLDHLYIHPEHQSLGIGTSVLLQIFIETDGQGRGIRVGALKGSDSNRFYARHGFELVEEAEWDNYYVRQPKHAV